MMILDNSAAISFVKEDEADEFSNALLRRVSETGAIVPALFHAEFANVLLLGQRRGRMTSEGCQRALALIGELPIEIDDADPDGYVLLYLGERYGLTAYDAWYLYLAVVRKLPLATRDEALRSAAKSIGIELVDA